MIFYCSEESENFIVSDPESPSGGSFTATAESYTINWVAPSGGVTEYLIDSVPTGDTSTTKEVTLVQLSVPTNFAVFII